MVGERERKRDKFLAAAAPTPVENGVAVGVALQKEMERGWRDGEMGRKREGSVGNGFPVALRML